MTDLIEFIELKMLGKSDLGKIKIEQKVRSSFFSMFFGFLKNGVMIIWLEMMSNQVMVEYNCSRSIKVLE